MERHRLAQCVIVAVLTVAGTTCAQADQGDIPARVRVLSIEPDVSTSGTLSTLNMGVNNSIVPEVDFTYMATNNIGVELILGITRHTVTSSLGELGRVNLLPPTLTVAWNFNPQGMIRPYTAPGSTTHCSKTVPCRQAAGMSESATIASGPRSRPASTCR